MKKKPTPKSQIKKSLARKLVRQNQAEGVSASAANRKTRVGMVKAAPLKLFANMSVLLQENRRLTRIIDNYRHQLEILRQTSVKITSELSLEQILNSLVTTVARFFSADAVSCMLWDENHQQLIIRAAVGFQTEYGLKQTIPAERVMAIAQQAQPFYYFENIQTSPQGNLELIREEKLCSVLTVIMRFGEELQGAINIYSRGKVRRFNEQEMDNAYLFSQQAAIAVRNAYLFEAMQEEAQVAKTLRQIAEEVGSLNSLEEVLNRIVILIIRAIKFRVCAVFLWDDKTKLFMPAKAIGVPPHRSPLFQTLILRREEIDFTPDELSQRVVVEAGSMPRRFPMEKLTNVFQERDLRFVPLVTKGKMIGMLIMAGYHAIHPFNHKDELFVQGIVAEAAMGIDDANLFHALENSFWDIIKSLAAAIEVKDSYTHSHSESVITYATAIGEESGLNPEDMDLLSKSCLVHDLGKIGIEDSILQKVTPLTLSERKNIEQHPIIGSRILHSVSSLSDVAIIVHHHHEHFDGNGYPDRLVGEATPLLARILAIADSFDAMTSDRPYREALTYEQAVNELKSHAGTQFDPELIEVFLRVLDRKKMKWGLLKSTEASKPVISG